TYLGPKKSIALVEVAGEKIVVGVTATHISMLTKVGREEDFGEVLKEQVNTESTKERVELQDELWEKV
ncbi:MAG TPA: flagellar biosynthetic protein FliO, partial [Nitrospirota bacterium]